MLRQAARRLASSCLPARGLSSSTPAASYTRNLAELEAFNRQRAVLPLGYREPYLAPDAWVAPNAQVIGNVELHDGVSVFYGAVLRGDLNKITVEAFSSIGDRAVVHAAKSVPTGLSAATRIGRYVTIGSGSLLRSVTVEREAIVGLRCIVMEGSVIESQAALAAGTVVPPGRVIPSGELWAGNPAKFVRKLTYDELHDLPEIAKSIQHIREDHAEPWMPHSTAYMEAADLRTILTKGPAAAH